MERDEGRARCLAGGVDERDRTEGDGGRGVEGSTGDGGVTTVVSSFTLSCSTSGSGCWRFLLDRVSSPSSFRTDLSPPSCSRSSGFGGLSGDVSGLKASAALSGGEKRSAGSSGGGSGAGGLRGSSGGGGAAPSSVRRPRKSEESSLFIAGDIVYVALQADPRSCA